MKAIYYYIIAILITFLATACGKEGTSIDVLSPDKRLKVSIDVSDSITYKVTFANKEIVFPSVIGLQLEDKYLGYKENIIDKTSQTVNNTIKPLYGKTNLLTDNYNETKIDFENNFSLLIRAYDEGVAYRFVTDMQGEIIVENELFHVNIDPEISATIAETDNYTSWELMYIDYESVSSIADGKRAITPVLFSDKKSDIKIVVAESDVRSYPGMYLVKDNNNFKSNFAQYPDSTALGSWGFVSVVQRTKDYIAKLPGKHNFPWRLIIPTDDDRTLLTNQLVYKLATPQILTDTDWIKPGKAAWEWWHDAMLPGADIPSGMDNRNTALYKHYVDFAAEYGLEYMMIDAGWSHIFNLDEVNPKVNIQEVIKHANAKNVGVFLWCTAMALTDDKIDKYLELMHNWGAVGIKVDFFDRDDQLAMDWYENVAKKAAQYKLMVNFHGCSKPTGLDRAYPNIVNYEAVRGSECNKWDLTANPTHHVTFPFIRMLTGTLDYTPGAMRNSSPQLFKPMDPGYTLAQGTRGHELAMFVIYDQYFAMLCDSPSAYREDSKMMDFLSKIPTSFDATEVLAAKVGEYILMAKQKGDEWYVGGMTNWTARNLTVDFSFLDKNEKYKMDIYKDASTSNLWATHYVHETLDVDSSTVLDVALAQGGGFVIRIYKTK